MRFIQIAAMPGSTAADVTLLPGIYALADDGSVWCFNPTMPAGTGWAQLPVPVFPAVQSGPMPTTAAQNIGPQASESVQQLQQRIIITPEAQPS